jgi:hypothetical protein
MGPQLLDLVANVLVNVLEGVEERRSDRRCSRSILDPVAQILFGGVRQPAIGMIDDHEFPGFQQIVGDDERTKSVFSDDTACISNNVGVRGLQAEREDGEPRVHAGEHGEMALRARSEPPQFMGARIEFVGLEDFVDYAHGFDSLAKHAERIRIGHVPERQERQIVQKRRGWRLGSSLPKYS